MTFHETFWVAIAAVAPLIALANQVTLIDSLGTLGIFRRARATNPPGTVRAAANMGFRAAIGAYGLGYTNLLVQAAMLLVALESLYYRDDVLSPQVVIIIQFFGLSSGILGTSLFSSWVQAARARLNTEGHEESNKII